MTLRISVVTAVYNGRSSIEDAITSVARQSYAHKEHVIQDGASTDGTAELVASIPSEIIRLQSEPDHGVYDAFNRGLRRASGDVIAFLGADDMYESDGALATVAQIMTDPGVDIVSGDAIFVRKGAEQKVVRYYRSGGFGPQRLRSGVIPAHSATFVRRAVFDRFGKFDTSFRIAGDFEWFARVFGGEHAPRWRHVPEPLVRMRLGGLSTAGPRSTWIITKEIRQACAMNGVPTSYVRLASRFPAKLLEFLIR